MSHALELLVLGSILLLALAAHYVGRRAHVPRVTLLILLGAVAGPQILNLVPAHIGNNFTLVTELTLAMVGFLLGEQMSFRELRQGRQAIIVSLSVTLVTALVIFLATLLVTGNIPASLLLAAIATATDPAATLDVIKETRSRGPLTRLVAQVVAIDDAWGAILFSIMLVFAELFAGNGISLYQTIHHGVGEVAGAVILGVVLGLPMAWLTGRIRPGEPMLLESAGFVFLAAGIAGYFNVSYLLTAMTLGGNCGQYRPSSCTAVPVHRGPVGPLSSHLLFSRRHGTGLVAAADTRITRWRLCTGQDRRANPGRLCRRRVIRRRPDHPPAKRGLPAAPGRCGHGAGTRGHRAVAGAELPAATGGGLHRDLRGDRAAGCHAPIPALGRE